MGGQAQTIVVGPAAASVAAAVVDRVADLEQRWSRFIDDSDVCRLARSSGVPMRVHADTVHALECATIGWTATAGRFDPTVGTPLVALGYDRTYDELDGRAPMSSRPRPAPGMGGVHVAPVTQLVTVPSGVRLDFGAFGKGLAADVAVEEALEAGAEGICVNLGGDLRVAGTPPDGDAWCVSVEAPGIPGSEIARLVLAGGGVATSDPDARTWRRAGVAMRHVVDPATGSPVQSSGAVTVVAGECWWAEVLATAATVAGPTAAAEFVPALGGEFLHAARGGGMTRSAGLAGFLAVVARLEVHQ